MKKKALFFLFSTTGGAERMTITIGKLLPQNEFDVKFVIVGPNRGTIGRFIPSGYEVEYLRIYNIGDFVTFRMIAIMKRERPHVVFCSLMFLSVRMLMAARWVGDIKTVVRNDNYLSILRSDQLFLCKLLYPYSDVIIAQQEEMKSDIASHIPKVAQKIVVLQNPLDLMTIDAKAKSSSPFTENKNEKVYNYVCVARFAYSKGQDVLAQAFVILAEKNPYAHLYFIGMYNEQDPFYVNISKMVNEAGLKKRVHFVGFDDNPYRWMCHCDCLVLPSRIEGLPNVLIEAQYLGIPVVVTASIPVIKRIVSEGVNGYIVPLDNPEAMAEAMDKALELHNVPMTYQSAMPDDFVRLFR